MKTTLVLKDELVRDAKKRAAELGITLSELTERALRDLLAAKPIARTRVVLPTFGHGLPMRDDLTPARIKELEHEADQDYVQRLDDGFKDRRR